MPEWTKVLTTNTHIIQKSGRFYTRYNYWYYPSFTYGTNSSNWNSTRSQTTLESSWFDSFHPILVFPYAADIKSFAFYGNATVTNDYEFALLRGKDVDWDDSNGDDFNLLQIGNTQQKTCTAHRYNIFEQSNPQMFITNLGGGAMLTPAKISRNDTLIPAFRRTTNNTSTYAYFEGTLTIELEFTK